MALPIDELATLSVWSDESVRIAQVLDAIEDMRRGEVMPTTRTSVLTLVIHARSRGAAATASDAVRELGARHPARVLTLLIDEKPLLAGKAGQRRTGTVDAEVRLLGGHAEDHAVWFEDVNLRVGGALVGHLDSVIEPFTLSDLPVVVWFVDGVPALDDPVLDAADLLVVDARGLGDTASFATLSALCDVLPVIDLSWVRLQPWRELLAELFEGGPFRRFASSVVSAEVRGKTGPAHLLGGWLTDRLDLAPGRLQLTADDHVSLRLAADDDGQRATFTVARSGEERLVSARAEIEGGPASASVVRLPDATPAWGLAAALSRLEPDPVYERALRRALS